MSPKLTSSTYKSAQLLSTYAYTVAATSLKPRFTCMQVRNHLHPNSTHLRPANGLVYLDFQGRAGDMYGQHSLMSALAHNKTSNVASGSLKLSSLHR